MLMRLCAGGGMAFLSTLVVKCGNTGKILAGYTGFDNGDTLERRSLIVGVVFVFPPIL